MKKIFNLFILLSSGIGLSQHNQNKLIYDIVEEYELIRSTAGYFENPNFEKIPLGAQLLFDSISLNMLFKNQPQLDIVPVTIQTGESFLEENFITYFNKFDKAKYTDSTKFKIECDLTDVVICFTQDIDDPNFEVTIIGYQESIFILNNLTQKPELWIDIFYFDKSSIIRGVNVFMADRIGGY